jgi:pimeloyl-ACP methyl ester carboxylesterase
VRAVIRWTALALSLAGTAPQPALAQEADPNAAFANELIAVPLQGHSISALVTHRPGATKFTHAVAIFPGSPGQARLSLEDGAIKFGDLRGNFLVRARRHFLEEGFLTVVVDAPSDRQFGLFSHEFRASSRYGEDVRAIVEAVTKRYGELDWTFAGHSEGAVSAVHAARMAAPPVKRVVLAASLTSRNFQGPGVRFSDVKPLTVPVLWVHHRRDPCRATPYSTTKAWAEEMRAPLLTVNGSKNSRGDPCEARTEHGFVGMEVKTVKAILAWIRTGQAPSEISE